MQNEYWKEELKGLSSFNFSIKKTINEHNFENIRSNILDINELELFLSQNNISFFEFCISILSLYLSRISGSEGIIFAYNNLTSNDTLFKIRYEGKNSLLDKIFNVKTVIFNSLKNSMGNLKEYVEELYPEYADYIFNYSIVDATKKSNVKNDDSSIRFIIFNNAIEIEYDKNTFKRNEMEFLLENIEYIIKNFLKIINQSCCDINIVCDRQLNLLNEFSKGLNFDIKEKSLPDIICDMAKKYPNNFAINDEKNRITYQELDKLINSTTSLLQNTYNISKSDKIILNLSRSYYIPLLTISLMKLGATTIPIDDSFPESYIQKIIDDSSAKYIIQEDFYEFNNIESIELNSLKTSGENSPLTEVDVDLDGTALILYTSGVTGVPKGVEITQRNIININYNYINYFNIDEGGTGNFMCLAKFTFVASIPIYAALMHGCEAFIIRETSQETIPRIVKYLTEFHCYILISTQELGLYLYNNFDLNLDKLIFAGSSLTKAKIRKNSSTELLNAYGCTETSGSVIINKINKDFSNYSVIGRPLGNSNVYILDENKKQMPIGSVGEIVISGPIVTKKYFNNPEQTNKAYGMFNNEKAYFTNDLGYFNDDGNIVYLGRKDNQVNLNGFRIEPEQIESAISEYEDINQVIVTVGEVNHQNHLIAYYSSDINIDKISLKEYLNHNLPSYMVPSFYMQIESFSLNNNGKIDVNQLPSVKFEKVEFVGPRNDLEEQIVDCFEKEFNQKISIYDDFIQLGGNSVTAMKIIATLNDYNITIDDLVKYSTPQKIAKHIKNKEKTEYGWNKYTLESGCPLNESQLNVYLDIEKYKKDEQYIVPLTIDMPSKYSAKDVENALKKLFNAHPIIKTHIELIDGTPHLKLGNMPEINTIQYNKKEIMDFMNKTFDLNKSLSRFLITKENNKNILVAVFHHVIFDGFSSIVFKQHLFNILENKTLKTDNGIVKSTIYDEEMQKSSQFHDAENFYEKMLSEANEVLPLLSCVKDNQSGFYTKTTSIQKDVVKEFLKSNNITENILFTSVFAYTLSRFTGDDKALFNILDNGRDKLNNYESIGMYVNTLPLLINCENKDITSFIEHVKNLTYNDFNYDFYPYRKLAKKFDVDSSILFQYIPDFYNDVADEYYTNSDLEFRIIKNDDKYFVKVIYSNVYSIKLIERFVESYNMILNQMLSVDKLSEINYIASSDLDLLNHYNQTEQSLEYGDILDAFDSNLSRCSDNILVGFNNQNYTHGEGAYIANKISDELHSLDVVKQDYVALFVLRSEWFLLASLGVLTAGAIYVPIDIDYPDERILVMLLDSQPKVVIVTDKTQKRIKDIIDENNLGIEILNVSNITEGNIKSSNHLNYDLVDENDIACVLYTSGSTGTPKGVLISRKAINNFVSWYVEETDFTAADVYGMYCSYVFDMHTHALYSPLITGGSLYVVPDDIRLDLKELNKYYIKHNCSHTYITSQVGKLFAESKMETSIKLLCFGGMKLGKLNAPDSIGPFESYGPSENLAISTSIFANKRIDNSSIGHFINNVKGYVLDNEHRRVPLGAVGELYLSGHQLTPGYLNREDENEKVFFDNPFDNDEGYERIYKTGDIVRFLPDGTLGIIGRRDKQVKIRGNRVELSEVESIIRELDYVGDVTVQTIKNNNNYELVAYVVSQGIDENELMESVCEYVGENKPDYMIPSFVVKLNEIPLTVNGKIDIKALSDVDLNMLQVEYIAPRTEIEQIIVDVFKEIFQLEKISLYDDFIRLGGDSIIAIRMVSSLQKYHISCSAKDILSYKTPYLISQHVKIDNSPQSYEHIEGRVDLLPIQSYFFDQINENTFTQQFVLKINGDLDITILQDSLDELVNIHDMLRAVYKFDEDNNPIQEILPLNTCICDINEHVISENFDENMKNILIESIQNINITNRLIDINLIHYKNENYLIIVIHHLIIDGLSWNNLLVDLTQIYFKLLNGEKINLMRSYPYKYWVNDVKNLVENITDEEKQHWINVNNQLNDSSIKGKGQILSFNVKKYFNKDNILRLSEEEYLALAIARAYKKTYGENVIFNRESHGRDDGIANVNQSIGWFTSQYPVLVKTNNGYDEISLIKDAYNLKTAFRDIRNLGLNYASLIYTTQDFEYKHCPITFNFLSDEFILKNEIFKSINHYLSKNNIINSNSLKLETHGITLNISCFEDLYMFNGIYADNTYLSDKIIVFVENIKSELKFIDEYEFEEIICTLSEPQLGVYLDEKINNKNTAYSVPGYLECNDKTDEEIKNAIHTLIKKHPILKGRIIDDDMPLFICDNHPTIEITNTNNYRELIKPFDLDKSLVRFFIVDNDNGKSIFYDMHHVISDATSRIIINNELNNILNGESDNNIDLSFINASEDDFESQFKPNYEMAHKFFIEKFADIDDIHQILTDINACKGSVSLPIKGIKDKIDTFTHKIGITKSNLLNIVFAYTYSRFTGENKVYYTFTEHGRHEKYMQNSLGMYIRTIPIIVDCKNKPISEFLNEMSDLILNSMVNSVYPFRLLAKEFNLNNNVSFEYNYDLNDVADINEMLFGDNMDSTSEFSCIVNDLDDGFIINISHSDSFSQETAMRFANVYKEVLIQILDKKELCDIDYIAAADVELLNHYNQTEQSLEYVDILDAFNDNLSQNPDKPLVSMNNNRFSYAEGAFIADKIAKGLIDLKVKAQDCVAFLVERSELYMLSILGIMSVGCVYVPLDNKLPDNRIDFILKDCDIDVVIVSDKTYERACNLKYDCKILNISEFITDNSNKLFSLPSIHSNLACILYTSGTTGIPKGVKITRKSIINLAAFYVRNYGLTKDDIYGLYASIGFDVAIKAIFSSILAGSSLNIMPDEIKLDINALNDYLIKYGITHTEITTQVAKLFIRQADNNSLKVLTTGGEKLGDSDINVNYRFADSYGPTEACVDVTCIDVRDKIDFSSIGYLLDNTKAYILDNEFRQVPVGAVGELYLAGYQIAEGYLNRDEETNVSFLKNPFDGGEYSVLYRTGDMVRFLPDGSLSIIGRRDSQVKIRGNRVELTEIESIIRELDYVEDVTVQI